MFYSVMDPMKIFISKNNEVDAITCGMHSLWVQNDKLSNKLRTATKIVPLCETKSNKTVSNRCQIDKSESVTFQLRTELLMRESIIKKLESDFL